MRLNLGPGAHYAEGWTNLDTQAAADAGIRCDLIVDPDEPFAIFTPGSATRVYLGHVLEHVWWPDIPALLAQVRDVLTPGGMVLVTGPDMVRLIRRYGLGEEPWWLVEQAMEHADRTDPDWPGASHKWDCHEARLVGALELAGFADVTPTEDFDGWPVTNWSAWQCAVRATKP